MPPPSEPYLTKMWVKGYIVVPTGQNSPTILLDMVSHYFDHVSSTYIYRKESYMYIKQKFGSKVTYRSFIGLLRPTPTDPRDNEHDGLLMAFVLPPLSNLF